MRPARLRSGGTCPKLAIVASVTDGNAPTIVTNTTARSDRPNQTTASGSHAMYGVICSATTSGRIERRANSFRARPNPSAVPITIDTTNENARRSNVLAAASGIVPSETPRAKALHTSAGDGTIAGDTNAATIAQTTRSPATPASGGPSSFASRLTRIPPC